MILRLALAAALALSAAACTDAPHADPVPRAAAPTPTRPTISDDDPRFNCMTMGNRTCGPIFAPLSDPDRAAINADRAGVEPILPPGCLIAVDDTTTIVCPDGQVVRS